MQPCIEMKSVSKTYRQAARPAVEGVSIQISPGDKVGLIGANGSGKTTLMRLLLNFIIPDSGEVYILGSSDLEKARKSIGYVPEHQEGMENFSPRELLEFAAQMHGFTLAEKAGRIDELLAFANLSEVADELLAGFSKGMIQRVQICIALIHDPPILLLDEPMSGLDPGGQKDVRDIILRLKELTMIYASHQLSEIERFCNRVIFIHDGHILHQSGLSEIAAEVFTLELTRPALEVLPQFPGLQPEISEGPGERVEVRLTATADEIQNLIAALNVREIKILRLRSRGILEDLYHRYVTQARKPGDAPHG
ncbi:MAG: ABC transporter ATP-binding protein [Calditrichaeota bacterium]|nr:ABC transporter ATP-binding protein [Calditrichota bacterium]MCB0311654.1 ABC transporter ATP-binding protein [Calditrichota bacterium]MCB9090262.1 ABC transporter ATP-binding protein [Calditrichia bacterium]